jgi:hypothetical protein
VLVVVHHGNRHALAQLALDVETLGRLDVLEVDATERGFESSDNVDEPVRIRFVDFDVENVDTGKLFEQYRLAFHHRLGGQWADRPQPQNGGTVGHDSDQVATGRIAGCLRWIVDDLFTGDCHSRRVGQCQVELVDHALSRLDLQLARDGVPVVVQRAFAKFIGHR